MSVSAVRSSFDKVSLKYAKAIDKLEQAVSIAVYGTKTPTGRKKMLPPDYGTVCKLFDLIDNTNRYASKLFKLEDSYANALRNERLPDEERYRLNINLQNERIKLQSRQKKVDQLVYDYNGRYQKTTRLREQLEKKHKG